MATQTNKQLSHERCIGEHPHGPKKCIECRQPFKEGERWLRMTSAEDHDLGCYTIGIHESCALQSHQHYQVPHLLTTQLNECGVVHT